MRLLEASLSREIRDCVLISIEKQKNEILMLEKEKILSDSKDVQANLLKRIKILENEFKRSQAQKYYVTRSLEVSDNSAANTLDKEDTPLSSSTVVEENEAPQIVTSSEELVANELNTSMLMNQFKKKLQKLMEILIGDPSKPVMIGRRIYTDAEMYMYALTVSTMEPKNVKQVMLDHNWIESMQDELKQFKHLDV
ncbi:hypothetical protein Tco_0103809 [Tanacetum coccineum]